MLPAVLLTPLMLAAEMVRTDLPEQVYDHRTQTSTFKGSVADQVKAKYTFTHTTDPSGRTPGDAEGDDDGR
jgi:hypothetical protein